MTPLLTLHNFLEVISVPLPTPSPPLRPIAAENSADRRQLFLLIAVTTFLPVPPSHLLLVITAATLLDCGSYLGVVFVMVLIGPVLVLKRYPYPGPMPMPQVEDMTIRITIVVDVRGGGVVGRDCGCGALGTARSVTWAGTRGNWRIG
ncbi:hypothetical protein CPB86DRAFT_855464 [Serendipita vermifera]|nr:hypothetical protein CPB86DRAFT_855464 [Serendipita vermifera]